MPNELPAPLVALMADPYDRLLARSILGSDDAETIHAALGAFCRARLGSALADVFFGEFSVGTGFGLALADGRRVFLKAWSAETGAAALDAVHTVQAALAARGFPAPGVLVRPTPFMAGRAAVMEWLDRGAQQDANRPALRRAMAATLARQVELALPYVELPGLPRHSYPQGAAWGATHNAFFDFAATAQGAEWIDRIAVASAEAARGGEGRLVLGHRDWRVQNVRFLDDRLSAVYDWDSLRVAREPEIVGMAAATFTSTFDIPVARALQPPEGMAAFIADYEAAVGRRFTAGERRTAGAAATHLLAYTARCEHCGGPSVDPDGARGILRRYAVADPANVLAGLGPGE